MSREDDALLRAALAEGKAIEKLLEDRSVHLRALRAIASMTETGVVPKGGYDIYRIAKEALRGAAT
jgi:hypothetical protein